MINPPDFSKKNFSSDIFRAYDVRGRYPDEINEQEAYKIGRAFVKFLKKRNPDIVIGRDNRFSSKSLKEALLKGMIDSGANVIDIGFSTSPMFYFTVAHFKFDGGVIVTASHLPSEYNGFKFVREGALPVSEKTGLKEIKNLVNREQFFRENKKGKISKKKIISEYLKFNLRGFRFIKNKKIKLIVDTANAVPGILIPYLKKALPFKIYSLFGKLDGNFPNHSPDPLIEKNLERLKREVKLKRANLGIAFDGDGDRIIFVDEKGKRISPDLITGFLSGLILEKNPGQKILYDLRSSKIVREIISQKKGLPVMGRVGHSFIKERMRKENILFAGEFSGHYYHRDHYFSEAPLFVLFTILKELSETQKPISRLIKPYQRYFHSGEINFKIKNEEEILSKFVKKYGKGKISRLDGLRIDFKNWWFLVRPSQTESVLRLVIEAETKKLLLKKQKELVALINP